MTRNEALETARAVERDIMAGRYRGPLHGIPVAVKDTHYTKGIKTTCASPVHADFVPSFDATTVTRLKAAGAVLMGETNLPEFSSGVGQRDEQPMEPRTPDWGSRRAMPRALPPECSSAPAAAIPVRPFAVPRRFAESSD